MRVLVIHLHYKTPKRGGALRSYYLVEGLAKRGFEIEVITAHNERFYKKEIVENTQIHYLPISYFNSYGSFKRIRSFLLFNRKALKLIGRLNRPDILYCISTPLTTGLLAIKAKKKWNLPYFFEVGDLWPDAPIQMGVIKSNWIKRMLYKMEAKIYQNASSVIALSPSIQNSINSRFPATQTFLFPNMSDMESFSANGEKEDLMHPYQFVIGYLGAVGKANHLEFMLSAANYFNETKLAVGFLVMGEGSEFERLKNESDQIPNIKFLPLSGKEVVSKVLGSIDAVYISYRDIAILETGSPNKFFDGLAAGKPIILNFGGWIADLISENRCGFTYNPHQPDQLESQLKPLLENPDLAREYGENSRKLAMKFEKESLLDEFAEYLSATEVTS